MEDDADEAPTVENSYNLVPTRRWGVESRDVRKGDVLFMYDRKSTSAKNKEANRANYTELDTGKHQ